MNTKLTLNINEAVIAKAKIMARKKKTSISRLVEEYLTKISSEKEASIVDLIIKNAPVKKTRRGAEKKILLSRLKEKYDA
jgi:uncharacterized protein YeeX (DUF496 family)